MALNSKGSARSTHAADIIHFSRSRSSIKASNFPQFRFSSLTIYSNFFLIGQPVKKEPFMRRQNASYRYKNNSFSRKLKKHLKQTKFW